MIRGGINMKKRLLGLAVGLAVGVAGMLGGTQAQAASGTVKIGGVTVERQFLNIGTYYRANRAITVHVTYYRPGKTTGQYTKAVTVPKGTVIEGRIIPKHHIAKNRWGDELAFNTDELNDALTRAGAKRGYQASGGVAYALKSLQKVKTPAYLPTYSYGDLYLGGAQAARQNQPDTARQSVRITANGYVELHPRSAKYDGDATFAGKPSASAKILRTRVNGATRYLYLKQRLTPIKTTRVGKRGAYQYRLALKNLHRPQNLSYEDDDRGTVYVFSSLYALGGVTYYTPICFGSDIED